MELKESLLLLRKNIRINHKKIINSIISQDKVNICVFCGSENNLTKEHVIPKWVFGNRPEKYFTTNTNGLDQTYSKATIPACSFCNTQILSTLEHEIVRNMRSINLAKEYFSGEDHNYIILWLEIIEFKFHVLNMRRRFLKSKNGKFIPYLSDFPISILQNDPLTPSQIFSVIRKAHRNLAVKSKRNRYNSLVVFRTTNPDFHFIHTTDHFIFLELAEYGVAFFYFFNREFKRLSQAHKEANIIIDKVY